uniref:TAFH domain-containing protein n=1 Tax=Knipowitschia caucasica TaxID=637954 RepID=A0AAV2LSR1_KNICA
MAGASDPLEDMLFSEVDEKAVSDLVGSLESQLSGQNSTARKAEENGGAGSVAHANHNHQLPTPGHTTTQEHQQQQGRCNKPGMRQSHLSKSIHSDKSSTPRSSDCPRSLGEPSPAVITTSTSIPSHGTSTTTQPVTTLTSTVSISTAANRSHKSCSSPSEPSVISPRKRISTPRRTAAARVKSLNGAAVSTRRSSASPNSPRPAPPSVNNSTFTLSSGQAAIALDRAPSPSPAVVTCAQLCPGAPSPQRIATPQLIVRPPQQQTTIQLPPGFTIPPGMVLVRTELGQLVMVPQQALAQVQAQAQAQAQAQNNSPRPTTPNTGTSFRGTTPQKGPVAIAVTSTQQTPVVMAPQASSQAASQPVQSPAIAATPGAPVVSQEMQENVKKCKNFLATLIKLASHNSPSPETSKNVKALVQDLLDAKIEPEEFTSRLQAELKSSPQPYLVPFLKKSLPALRLSLLNSQQSLTQPPQLGVKPVAGSVAPAVMTGPSVRTRHPNSVTTSISTSSLPASAMGFKATGSVGGQVRMPVVITQSIRAQGTMGKGAAIQVGKSPMGLAVQISGKNKLNDPGGGSFRDDDDINDVASMAGVNLNEESARILATNSELVGTHIRSCKDEAFLHPILLHRRILETAKKYGVSEVPMEAVTFISHATQSRLRTLVEKVSTIAQHRLDSCKDDESHLQTADVRSQLRFFEQLERIEKQKKDEQEREILLKAAKSRSRQEDPEQARLKQKAKEMQQQELAQMRQRDANLTALAAIGPRKKRKLDSPGSTSSGTVTEAVGSAADSPAGSSSSSRHTRQRITRVNLRDLIFYMEQERDMAHSVLLYRALLK